MTEQLARPVPAPPPRAGTSHQVPAEPMPSREQQLALLPDNPPAYGGPAAVPADPIVTSGRTEYTVRCDGPGGCGAIHRHTGPGIRTGPCGATYTVPCGEDLGVGQEQDSST